MSQSLMDLILRLVEIESRDAAATYGEPHAPWAGSDEARAALAMIEARIEAIRDAVRSVHGVDETVPELLDGTE